MGGQTADSEAVGTTDQVLDRDAVQLWARALDARTIAFLIAAVTTPWLPTLQDDRLRNCGFLLGVVVPYSAWLAFRVRRRGSLDAFMPVTDILLAIAFAAMVPAAWPAILGVAVADVAFAVVLFGRRMALLGMAVAAIGLAATGSGTEHSLDVGVIGFLTACGIVIATVGSVTSRERALRRSYTALVNGVDGIVWESHAPTNTISFVSAHVETMLGWTVEEGRDVDVWAARIHPDDAAAAMRRATVAGGDAPRTTEFRVRHADGHYLWLRDSRTIDRDEAGNILSVRGIAVDVTSERESALALQQYADIVEQIQFSLMVWHLPDPGDDLSIVAVRANPAAVTQFGIAAEAAVGQRLVDAWTGPQAERFASSVADTIRTQQAMAVQRVPFPRPDGTEGWVSIRIFPLPGSCAGILCEDVTDEHHAELQLRHQALHDSLTGLPNRALLQDRLTTALAVGRRTGQAVGLLVLDLDQFKEINDTLGHPMGDRMLEQVGNRLASVLRDCDTVARLGGDEFAVLLTSDVARAGAERVALRVREALAEPFDLDGIAVQTAASVGIVLSPDDGVDAETLTQRADIAMYNAKRSSRGHAFYAAEDDRSSLRRLSLVGELRRAIESDELVLHYQPQIDVRNGTVVGVEALVRWQHPQHGLLLPSEFIGLAEVSGTIQPLTRWVVRTAVAQAAALAGAGHPIAMSVNVSARNLYDPDLVHGIGGDLTRSGVLPERLMLERTESELVDDPSQVMTVLSLVSGMGVRLAIDDFGTGWSSLANLTRLPIHQIKIDRSFVSRMLTGGDDAVIVRSIVDLGHNLGLDVVAEGVEDAATLRALEDLGCDQAQGYLLSRAVPADQLLAWLDARPVRPALHLA